VLQVGGRQTYIEPQLLAAFDGRTLLAGSPTYEWFDGPSGAPEHADNRLLGALLSEGTAAPFSRPSASPPIGAVRVMALGPGHLLWLFDEVSTMSFREMTGVALSSVEWRSGSWLAHRPVPLPEGAAYSFLASSPLVFHRGRPRWVLAVTGAEGETRALLYTYELAAWHSSVLDTLAVESTAAASVDDIAWVALTGPDPAVGARTVRVMPVGGAARALHAAQPGERIVGIELDAHEAVSAAWISVRTGSARTAYGAVGLDTESPLVFPLEDGSEQAVPVALSAGVVWLTHRTDPVTLQSTLNVHRLGADGPYRVASFPYPFEGYFAAAASGPSELVVVGPETTADPANRIVRSLLLRYFIDCR